MSDPQRRKGDCGMERREEVQDGVRGKLSILRCIWVLVSPTQGRVEVLFH